MVHHEVAQALVDGLDRESSPSSVLEIGVHTGLLTEYWREIFPECSAVLMDIWPGFKDLCLRDQNLGMVANGEQLPLKEATFDLIISGATFQWYRDWSSSLTSTLSLLKSGGTLAFSQFCRPSLEPFKSAVEESGRDGSFLPLKSHEEILLWLSQQKNFKLASELINRTLFFETPQHLVQHLRRLGVTASRDSHRPWTRSQWKQCHVKLEALREEEGIPLQYAVGVYWLTRVDSSI